MSADPLRAERIAALGYEPAAADMEAVGNCNLCAGKAAVEVARRDRYGFALRCVVCSRCGLGRLDPRPKPEAYAAFYNTAYRPLVSAYHGRTIDAQTVQTDQRAYAAELVEFLDHHMPTAPATVLDVGGSTGVVAAAVAERFRSHATVLDPAAAELDVAAGLGMETIAGFAEDFDAGGRQWELVLLCQTIDHLLDISATLRALRSLTADGGHAFVDVLDLRFALNRKGAIEGAVKVDHPFYLTRATATAFLMRAGFATVAERLSDDGHWGFLVRAATASQPDWDGLTREADMLLADIWQRRARS